MALEHLWCEIERCGYRAIGHNVAEILIYYINATTRNTARDRSVQRLAAAQGLLGARAFESCESAFCCFVQQFDLLYAPDPHRALMNLKAGHPVTFFYDRNTHAGSYT